MFFEKIRDARLYASLETTRTHRVHKVQPCKKYLCPPNLHLGKDFIKGFTIVLTREVFEL